METLKSCPFEEPIGKYEIEKPKKEIKPMPIPWMINKLNAEVNRLKKENAKLREELDWYKEQEQLDIEREEWDRESYGWE